MISLQMGLVHAWHAIYSIDRPLDNGVSESLLGSQPEG